MFNQLANAIQWILQSNYHISHVLHYLNDFLTAGPANSTTCSKNLNIMLALCDKINALIKLSKVEGPTTCLTFLGIQINTTTMEASTTSERKESLLNELQLLHSRHK